MMIFVYTLTFAINKNGEGLGGTGSYWHSDCFNSGNSFFHRGFPFW